MQAKRPNRLRGYAQMAGSPIGSSARHCSGGPRLVPRQLESDVPRSGEPLEEAAVVRDEHDGTGVTVERPLELFDRFDVRDQGLGIPGPEQRRIFDKFYRLDPDLTRGVGGTGLGLYICRELVRRMDGRIWVESREGAGSTFSFELPAA